MNIVKEEKDNLVLLKISGASEPLGNKNFSEVVDEINNRQDAGIDIDLSGMDYMDSTSIGIMLRLYKSQKQKNQEFRILNASDKVSSLLTLCSLSESLIKR